MKTIKGDWLNRRTFLRHATGGLMGVSAVSMLTTLGCQSATNKHNLPSSIDQRLTHQSLQNDKRAKIYTVFLLIDSDIKNRLESLRRVISTYPQLRLRKHEGEEE